MCGLTRKHLIPVVGVNAPQFSGSVLVFSVGWQPNYARVVLLVLNENLPFAEAAAHVGNVVVVKVRVGLDAAAAFALAYIVAHLQLFFLADN